MYISLDIGGTKFMVAAFNEHRELVRKVRADTPYSLEEGISCLISMVREVAEGRRIDAIGASAGGPLCFETGVVSPLHMPSWNDVPLKAIFEQEFNAPFCVDVDTNAAALAEYTFGCQRVDRLLYVTVSTGVGGGFVVDGQLYRGANGEHPEIGHQMIPYTLPVKGPIVCACGGSDCLEAIVSGTAIAKHYKKPADQLSESEWREVGANLGRGLRNATVLYAPSVIALGGGVSVGGGDVLLEAVRQEIVHHVHLVSHPTVIGSALGYDSALWGGLAMAFLARKRQTVTGSQTR